MSHIVKPRNVQWDFLTNDDGTLADVLGPNGTRNYFMRGTVDASGNIIGLAGAGANGADLLFGGALGQLTTSVTAPVDTNENILYSLSIPANTLGVNDSLRITHSWTCTNNANTKTIKILFDASSMGTTSSLTSQAGGQGILLMSNRGARNSQIYNPSLGFSYGGSSAMSTSAFDFANTRVLNIAMTKATAGDTVSLDRVLVELIRGV